MAPDGLTAYIIGSQSGTIAYYDVLSGTADLTVTRIPSFTGQVFIHPDGTRLFWDAGQLEVFDLTTRKIVNEFKFGLPTTSATSMQMSQDGSKVYVGNGLGAVVILDTRYGNVLGTFQSPGPAQVFGGPEAN
jgi:WD40 repeat protein